MNRFISKIFLIFFSTLIAGFNSYPQDSHVNLNANIKFESSSKIKLDTSRIDIREIDSSRIKSYLKDKDFSYFENPEDTKTLWDKLIDWIKKRINMLIHPNAVEITWEYLQYILIVFAVLALIYGLYRNEIKGLFIGNQKSHSLNNKESVEDISTIDFDKMIDEALENKNYRFAVRLNYLRTLKILSDKKIINWKPDKTNHDYFNEIKFSDLSAEFLAITNDFENIWYGGIEITQNDYSLFINRYSNVNSLLENY